MNIIVIGGGASGIAAAIAAASGGASVLLLEQNEKLGKKLFITGKGRCNLTNASDMKTVQEQVVSNGRFLYSAFDAFTNRDIVRLVEENGCPVKTERGNRVFPVSDHSSDVIRALERALKKAGVRVRLFTRVKEILTEALEAVDAGACGASPAAGGAAATTGAESGSGAAMGSGAASGSKAAKKGGADRRVCGVRLDSGEVLSADAVILATGGISYASTGSTGDGHRMAEGLGLKVTELIPSLVPLVSPDPAVPMLQGLALKNVEITLRDQKKELYRDFGELLFTHFGFSGPVILSASAVVGPRLKKGPLELTINLKPALTEEQLDARLLRDFQEASNRDLKNALDQLFPSRLIGEVIRQSGISPEKKVHDLTREDRAALRTATTGLRYTVTGTRGFTEAIVTKGGVSVKEISPSTMESKKIRGLFLAGELLDLDAMTGGYNLQIAWSTGHLAGASAAAGSAGLAVSASSSGGATS